MPTNIMNFNQVATILNSIQQQATGQAALTATNTADFVTNAITTLQTGRDPVMNAISQVLSRTIFSVRPYSRKFGLMEISEAAYGNHVRKLQVVDRGARDDDAWKWPVAYDSGQTPADGTGQSVDQQTITKPIVLMTNYYGSQVFEDSYTIMDSQLDCAFTGPGELGSFISMVTQNMVDKLEQNRENLARMICANFIGSIIDANQTDRMVHLLTEYNTLTGLSLTATTVFQPANYPAFIRWAFARILSISDMLTERSQMFQTNITNYPVQRHTPKDRQKMLLWSPADKMMTTMALADTYHEELLRLGAYETVNYWQSIQTPDSISVTPGYIDASGAAKTGSAVSQANVFGVLFDEEAMGYATMNQRWEPAPHNARGLYTTTWIHELLKTYQDTTEKGVIFLLD
jgi:hypothetical protein